METSTTDVRYPTGKYEPQPYSDTKRLEWLNEIRILPTLLEQAIANLDEAQLDTPYREGGWKIKQVVHHIADSHMNAYIRFKLGLTEDTPTIKPYSEKAWAALKDSETLPVNISTTLVHALHARLYETLKDLDKDQWQRTVFHPQHNKELTLWHFLGLYAWHGKHHVAHITNTKYPA